jgi:ketosteroid isomerase-like protein
MTVTSATTFDIEAFKRAYEQWDIEALLDLYAEDVELVRPREPAERDVVSGDPKGA